MEVTLSFGYLAADQVVKRPGDAAELLFIMNPFLNINSGTS
jgi:hypothetical protein